MTFYVLFTRNMNFDDVKDCLNNPLDYGKIRTDTQGRKRFLIYGKVKQYL